MQGEFSHQLDQKNRLRLPPRIKSELGERPVATIISPLRITLYSEEKWAAMRTKLDLVPQSDEAAFLSVLKIYGNTYELEFDPQGRAVLPEKLRKKAGVTKNIVTVGVGNHAQLWDEETYNKFIDADNDDYKSLLHPLKDYGI